MANELITALELIEKEKNIKKEDLLEALKAPLITAYKKYYGAGENVFVEIDDDGKITVHEKRTVVEEAEDYDFEISALDGSIIDLDREG